jgi:uncharacterized protein
VAHRVGPDGGLGHPSVYCADLYRLITHIRGTVGADLRHRAALVAAGTDRAAR